MELKKKVLFVTTRFPWPLNSGFANKNFWLIKNLSKKFEVTLVIIEKKIPQNASINMVSKFCNVLYFKPNFFDFLFSFIHCITFDKPLQLSLFFSKKARDFVDKHSNDYDIIICSVIRSIQYIKNNKQLKIFDLADSLFLSYRSYAEKVSGFKKYIYLEEARRLKKYEKKIIQFSDHSFFFNKNEVKFYKYKNVSQIPHGVDPKIFSTNKKSNECKDGLVFIGKMDYFPNYHAIKWFCENVYSLLSKNIKVYVIGFNSEKVLEKLSKKYTNLKVMGFVENPYPIIKGAIASICPVQIGGGIQNKVIESMALGVNTLVSPLASKAFDDFEKTGLLLCSNPKEWQETIQNLIEKPKNYESHKIKSLNYANDNFSWDAYFKVFLNKINLLSGNLKR